jgi:CubicO group peptidase (beta-lactamase class C family)
MNSTQHNPPPKLLSRIARRKKWAGVSCNGQVHGENCYVMGGVCGNAGLFSTAGDLGIYAQMILNGGSYGGKRVLKQSPIDLFEQRQNLPPGSSRALGRTRPIPAHPQATLRRLARSCTPASPARPSISIWSGMRSSSC